jgi:hypothetical protein
MTGSGLTDVVLCVVDTRPDPATEHFDAALAAAVADGHLDEGTARTLRWWQRESVRGVRGYLADALPPILDALDAAADGSAATASESARSWDAARGSQAAPHTACDTTRDTRAPARRPVSRPVASTAADRLRDRRRELVAGLVADPPPPPNGHQQRTGRPDLDEGRR